MKTPIEGLDPFDEVAFKDLTNLIIRMNGVMTSKLNAT
jgi:hypothetical protein